MNTTLLNMQIGAQRRMLGWLPEIAARRDARLIVGMGLAGAMLATPSTAAARNHGGGGGGNGAGAGNGTGENPCKNDSIDQIVQLIDYATKALIAVIGAVVLLRFAMAAWTLVASNKANRGKKALNDMMWVGAGLIIVIMIFPLRYGILLIVNTLFADSKTGPVLDECASEASDGSQNAGNN